MQNMHKQILRMIFFLHSIALNANTLFERAKEGKINSVKHLVNEKKQDVNHRTNHQTPLFVAVKYYKAPSKAVKDAKEKIDQDVIDYDQVIEFLLSQGASMAHEDKYGRTVFHYAVLSENPHLLKLLLANINRQSQRAFNIADPNGITPMHLAAALSNLEIVEILGEAGAKVDLTTRVNIQKPIDMVGILKVASAPTKASIKKYLYDRELHPIKPKPPKTSPRRTGEQGCTSPSISASAGLKADSASAIKSHVQQDGELNNKLMVAITDGSLKKVQDFIGSGASVAYKSHGNITPLMKAVDVYNPEGKYKEIIDYLLEHGSSLLDKDIEGKTALHYAVNKEDPFLVKELVKSLETKPDSYNIINAQDNAGNTPLHYAAMVTNVPIATILLQNRASINVQNIKHQIPLNVINEKESKVYTLRTHTSLLVDTDRMKKLLSEHGAAQPKQKPTHRVMASQPPLGAAGIAKTSSQVKKDDKDGDATIWNNVERARSYSISQPSAAQPLNNGAAKK